MFEFGVFFILLSVGFFVGSNAESRHYKSIVERERKSANLPIANIDIAEKGIVPSNIWLVSGSCVISVDYFKRFVANVRNFFGGRVVAYESLIDRARREALLRMKAEARDADLIADVRIETTSIGGETSGQQGTISIEVIAYGTAIKYFPAFETRTL